MSTFEDPMAEPAAAPVGPVTLTPVGESERIFALDALRGVALLGIFMVNMQFFALPLADIFGFGENSLADKPLSEKLSWGFIKVFCEFKFISMFSLLFGAGMVMQMMRARQAGRPFAFVFVRRLLLLGCFGLVHALGLWYGDILFLYACVGFILLFLRGIEPKTMLITAAVLLCFSLMVGSGINALQVAFTPGDPMAALQDTNPEPPADAWDAMQRAQFHMMHEAWRNAELEAYAEGPLADAMLFRGASWAMMLVFGLVGFGWRVLAMFLIGAAMMKTGFFSPERRDWQRRLATVGLGIGIPLELAAAGVHWAGGFGFNWFMVASLPLHEVGSLALCLGYVGTLCCLASSGVRGLLVPISRAGRMALSVYLSETIVATFLMYWWGLGWFGSLSRVEQIGLTLVIYAGLVVVAVIWLKAFRMGPFEWLWRSSTYLKLQRIAR